MLQLSNKKIRSKKKKRKLKSLKAFILGFSYNCPYFKNTAWAERRGGITKDSMKIKMIIKEYCEQLCACKFENPNEMDNSLKYMIY